MKRRWREVGYDDVDGNLVSDRVVNRLYDAELKSPAKQKEGLCSGKIGVGLMMELVYCFKTHETQIVLRKESRDSQMWLIPAGR